MTQADRNMWSIPSHLRMFWMIWLQYEEKMEVQLRETFSWI